jgi:hypothetical protein
MPYDVLEGPLIVMTFVIILIFNFDGFPPPPNCGVDFFLEGSLMPCHFALTASRKIAEIWPILTLLVTTAKP